jgi:hypothetical protein
MLLYGTDAIEHRSGRQRIGCASNQRVQRASERPAAAGT